VARIKLEQVVKSYDRKVQAVNGVSFEILDGEFFVLVGPSGCGKSTVLRLVAGLEDADAGDIFIGERRVNEVAPKDRDVAMVFQNYALYPHMSAFDNMAFGLKLRKFSKPQIDERVVEAARVLSIEHLLERKPKQLSGGERQRVAVGRAIVRNPKVFLFDEPLSNLDAKLRVQMRVEIAQLHKRLKTTMFYVTHDQVEAMTLGQRIGVMCQGRLLQIADAMTIYNRPANKFVAGFIGSPPMNLLDGELIGEARSSFRTEGLELPLPERRGNAGLRVWLGLRPEDIAMPEPGRDWPRISGRVEVVEPMGSETIAYVRVGGGRLVAKLGAARYPAAGETQEFMVNAGKAHLFDFATEARI
jgi:multiple sugar transport system ATP-binding protein